MKQVKRLTTVGTHTHTEIECCSCGKTRLVKGHPGSSKVEKALEQPCICSKTVRRRQHGSNWWKAFGLEKNPGIYGPMPWKRTSLKFRLKEAKEAGLNCWYWVDEFTDQR